MAQQRSPAAIKGRLQTAKAEAPAPARKTLTGD